MRKINAAEGTASHLPVLTWAWNEVKARGWGGSVLEYGGGLYSTAFLHELGQQGYPVCTIEADAEWRQWLADTYPGHRVEPKVGALADEWWDVVLIDHGNGNWIHDRAKALMATRNRCAIALVHDWHIGKGHRDNLVASFRYHGWFAPDDGTMHTAICSDRVPIAGAPIVGGYVYTGWDDAPGAWDAEGVWPN